VLWAPLLDASGFFKEAFRSQLITEQKDAVAKPTGRKELESRLARGEAVEGVAHSIQARLFQSSDGRSLEAEMGPAPRPVLMLPISHSTNLRPDLSAVADRWRAAGFDVDARIVRGDETWWLINDRWHDESTRPMTRHLIKETTGWLLARTTDQEDA
ncbi:MAG TPA: hypothetical protein VFZ75_13295, partial [Actinomycetota bacterium]|nr:hypothetical protein [Actinomycetota bacterium]